MKKYLKTILATATTVACLSTPIQAHRLWLLPSTFTLSGDTQWVTVDGAISNDLFFPNHVAMSLSDIHITAPDGSKAALQNGAEGKFRATFDIELDKQGTYRLAELGATYFARWQENGEPKRTRASLDWLIEQGITKKDSVKLMKAARRVETFVTLGAPSDVSANATGQGIELIPVTHPNDIYVDEAATFKFEIDGKPASDLQVTVIKGHDRYRDNSNEMQFTTDANGAISFTLPEAGRYWFSTSTTRGKTEEKGITMARRVAYTLTIEALAN
ncbi:MAG: DUF4198 domain-containing protein [Kordiimonas sp.]